MTCAHTRLLIVPNEVIDEPRGVQEVHARVSSETSGIVVVAMDAEDGQTYVLKHGRRIITIPFRSYTTPQDFLLDSDHVGIYVVKVLPLTVSKVDGWVEDEQHELLQEVQALLLCVLGGLFSWKRSPPNSSMSTSWRGKEEKEAHSQG